MRSEHQSMAEAISEVDGRGAAEQRVSAVFCPRAYESMDATVCVCDLALRPGATLPVGGE